MRLRILPPIVVLLAGAIAPLGAQDAADSLVEAALRRYRTPGISIAVTRDGRVIKSAGYGFANLELRVPATDSTVYQTGSIGKAFTAALVLSLVQDGKLGLDDPVAKFFPNPPSAWRRVTIRHLLTHTSGIADGIYDLVDLRQDYTDDQMVAKIRTAKVEAPPGARWSYSNQGYHLLGYLINRSQGRFYGDLLQERIFRPLGMASTRIIDEAAIIPHRAAGYRLLRDIASPLANQEYASPSLNRTADGSIYTTVLDMARWDLGLYGDTPLDSASRAVSWTPVRLTSGKTFPYGFAWQTDSVNGHWVVEHSGAWQGFTTHIARYPNDHLGVIVLTNCACGDPTRVAHDLAALYLPALRPAAEPPLADQDPDVMRRLGRALESLAEGTADSTAFTPAALRRWNPEARAEWATYFRALGPAGTPLLQSRHAERQTTGYQFHVTLGDIVHGGWVTFTRDGRIEELELNPE